MGEEQILESKPIYAGRVVNLHLETIELEDGSRHEREVIYHPGAVAMVPLDEHGNIILVEQWRSGSKQVMLELPAGGLAPDEDRAECARRELQEEIGFYPGALTKLGDFYVAASYTTEMITIFLAEDLRPSRLDGDADERITPVVVPFEEALRRVMANEIIDSKTLIGLTWAARRLGRL
ncbi:MAG: NUDIX hydrolase [Anaerolineae bacterium]|nr:NUDIX hydrolase [Anaerolineae bacterium]